MSSPASARALDAIAPSDQHDLDAGQARQRPRMGAGLDPGPDHRDVAGARAGEQPSRHGRSSGRPRSGHVGAVDHRDRERR